MKAIKKSALSAKNAAVGAVSAVGSTAAGAVSSAYSGVATTASYVGLTTNIPAQCLTKKVFIKVNSASNLMAADSNGKSDPFCMVHYSGNWKSTKIIKAELNPQWNEVIEAEVRFDDDIEFFIWDKDLLTNDILGYASVSLKDTSFFTKEGKDVKLVSRPGYLDEIKNGTINISLEWIHFKNAPNDKCLRSAGALEVHVIEARSLNPTTSGGKCDPYCRVSVDRESQRTKVKRGYINPVWEDVFYFPRKSGLPHQVAFEIKDDNVVAGNTVIGAVAIDTKDLKPNQPFDSWVPLVGVKTGTIHVSVTWHPTAFAHESKTFKAVKSAKKVTKATGNKMWSVTKSSLSAVFIKLPLRILVGACIIMCDRLKQKGYTGSVKGTIGLPTIRFGWNAKTKDSEHGIPHHVMSLIKSDEELTEEEKKHEGLLSKLVGLIVDRLLTVAKIMSHQMQEMNVSGSIGIKIGAQYLGPPTPGSATGLPTPIKFSLGIKVSSDSVPHPDRVVEVEEQPVVLEEQKAQLEKMEKSSEGGDENDALVALATNENKGALRVVIISADVTTYFDQTEETKTEKKEDLNALVAITSGDNYKTTQVKKGGVPVWQEELLFPLDSDGLPPPFIAFEVQNQRAEPSKFLMKRIFKSMSEAASNAIIGQAVLNLGDISPNTDHQFTLGLNRDALLLENGQSEEIGDSGKLQLTLRVEPNAPAPPPSLKPTLATDTTAMVGRGATQIKKKGVITLLIRAVTRAMAYACLILRKRMRERKIVGDVCTYYLLGPVNLSFEVGTEDSEVQLKKKLEDSLPDMDVGEAEKIKSLVQSAVDKMVDVLISGIAIGCKEMQKRHTKGNVYFAQKMALVMFPAEIAVGLYVDSDSIISGADEDIDIEELMAKEVDEENGTVVPTTEAGKKGALKVTVVQGRDLESADPLDTSTYARITVGDDYLFTKSLDQGRNPAWNQTMLFPAPTGKDLPEAIDVKVFDDNIVYSNTSLGRASIDIKDIKPNTPTEFWIPLIKKGGEVQPPPSPSVEPAAAAKDGSKKDKKDKKKESKGPMVRIVVVYEPDTPTPKISYPSIFGRVASGSANTLGKSAKRAGKGSIRTGFKVAIMATILGRDKINQRDYNGKSMASVTALFWTMTISLSSKNSKVLPPEGKKEHSAVVRAIHACYGKVLDIMSVGAETVQDLGTSGTLKIKIGISLPLVLANYFKLTAGLALETDSVKDRYHQKVKPITGSDAAFDIAKK